jgi:hypothetical protein
MITSRRILVILGLVVMAVPFTSAQILECGWTSAPSQVASGASFEIGVFGRLQDGIYGGIDFWGGDTGGFWVGVGGEGYMTVSQTTSETGRKTVDYMAMIYDDSGPMGAEYLYASVEIVDVSPPSVPSGLVAGDNTLGTNFTLSWTPSTDDIGEPTYEVFMNGTSLGTTTGTSMQITGLAAATTYTMAVRARDESGNWSACSANLFVTTPTASQPPGNDIPDWMKTLLKIPTGQIPATDNSGTFKVHKP